MSLDIYAGQLTRYYSGDWDTTTAQMAAANGIQYQTLTVGGNDTDDDAASAEDIRTAVNAWQDAIARGLTPALPMPLWDESNGNKYYTDQPGWEAMCALMLLQACQSLNRPMRKYVESGWDVFNEPAFKDAVAQKDTHSLLNDVTLWLPIDRSVIFKTVLPSGNDVTVSTVMLLKRELDELNNKLWQADDATIRSWRDNKYYVPVSEKPGLMKRLLAKINGSNKQEAEKYLTEDLAKCAFAMLYQAVHFAEAHKVPIVLDF